MRNFKHHTSLFFIILSLACLLILGGCSSSGLLQDFPTDGENTPSENLPTSDELSTPPITKPSPPIINAGGQLTKGQLYIQGRVSRKDDESVAGIIVTVTDAHSGLEIQVVVDEDGNFEITITVSFGDLILIQAEDPVTEQTSNTLEAVVPSHETDGTIDVPFEDASNFDYDGDGFNDAIDACPTDPTGHSDTDGDGICNANDFDDDGDGVPDSLDAFPFDPSEWADADGDGFGDNRDNCDNTPSSNLSDIDGDGIGDICDDDLDGDGIPNSSDSDRDGDGLSNTDEASYGTDPDYPDTDRDGVNDSDEINQGRNPVVNEAAVIMTIKMLLFD